MAANGKAFFDYCEECNRALTAEEAEKCAACGAVLCGDDECAESHGDTSCIYDDVYYNENGDERGY